MSDDSRLSVSRHPSRSGLVALLITSLSLSRVIFVFSVRVRLGGGSKTYYRESVNGPPTNANEHRPFVLVFVGREEVRRSPGPSVSTIIGSRSLRVNEFDVYLEA